MTPPTNRRHKAIAQAKPAPVPWRFDLRTLLAGVDAYAREYGLTGEAATIAVALKFCNEDDVAMAAMVLSAEADAYEAADGKPIDRAAVKAQLAELRLAVEAGGGALSIWEAIARDVTGRCSPDVA